MLLLPPFTRSYANSVTIPIPPSLIPTERNYKYKVSNDQFSTYVDCLIFHLQLKFKINIQTERTEVFFLPSTSRDRVSSLSLALTNC